MRRGRLRCGGIDVYLGIGVDAGKRGGGLTFVCVIRSR